MSPDFSPDVTPDARAARATHLLTVSGSLRAVSSNGAVLDAAAALAPAPVRVTRFDGLADLPAFNPDLDGEGAVDRKSTRLNSSHVTTSRMPSSA